MPNRLASESSPYLRQHADNPVDWYPWGKEALAASKETDKPILLSVGYAACHWCHVMAHESFEDDVTARMMNDLFVNVKVDREERPDIDSIYMQAVQAITGHGGWPMTVFLTPEGIPFYGGTYFPPQDRHGMPSFRRVLASVSEAWKTRREEVTRGADSLRQIYSAAEAPTSAGDPVSAETIAGALNEAMKLYDRGVGGFGGAPKFPQPMILEAFLNQHLRTGENVWLEAALFTFKKMADGGIYDQAGGGFHRYTVDGAWQIPHFEKMLYDNALITRLGVHLWQITSENWIRETVEETYNWLFREMTSPDGGWYSSLDADSEGHEGKFYIWTLQEIRDILGASISKSELDAAESGAADPQSESTPISQSELDAAILHWGLTESGNFENANILHVEVALETVAGRFGVDLSQLQHSLAKCRTLILRARDKRERPARDDKIIASWNGLMLRSVAEAARAFGSETLRTRALAAAEFFQKNLIENGRVYRSSLDGVRVVSGYLEDYAALGLGFIALYELTWERRWLDAAVELNNSCVELFWNDESGSFFDTAHDAEPLVTRPRNLTDNAVPSGNSLAVELQARCSVILGNDSMRRRAAYVAATLSHPMRRSPLSFGHLLYAADRIANPGAELVLLGDPESQQFKELSAVAAESYIPWLTLIGGHGETISDLPLLAGRDQSQGSTAYVCRNYSCELPTSDASALRAQLNDL